MTYRACFAFFLALSTGPALAQETRAVKMSRAEYQDRAKAAWIGQVIGANMGFQFEGKPASTVWVDQLPQSYEAAIVDDDYFYELVALRAFEKYGTKMSVEQLGQQWIDNNAGTWGSSEQTRLALARGAKGAEAGHPRNNRYWHSIGPQFSGDIYGMLSPGMPNVAASLARKYGHINGYAEGVDGAVFIAGMGSLAYTETDPKKIVTQAAQLISPQSPYRECIDLVIAMAGQGQSPQQIADAVEDRYYRKYMMINNAVANGGIVAIAMWFGEGDFLKTMNIAFRVADYADTDCNAANVGAITGAMHGMKGLPAHLVDGFHDRIRGDRLGPLPVTPPVDESLSDIARRIAVLGARIVAENGATVSKDTVSIPSQKIVAQQAELFSLADLMQYWNPDWKLDRAAFVGMHGETYLDGDVLVTYPRDDFRGLVLRRSARLGAHPALKIEVATDPGRAWRCDVYANNKQLLTTVIEGGREGREWRRLDVDLAPYAGQTAELRIFQRIVRERDLTKDARAVPTPGNAYWKSIRLD